MFRPQIAKNRLSSIANCQNFSSKSDKELVGIVGVPFGKGQPKPGVAKGPKYIRDSGLTKIFSSIADNFTIRDYGDVIYKSDKAKHINGMKNYQEVIGCNKSLYFMMQNAIKENDKVLVLGGDHSIGIGSVSGHLAVHPDLSLIWVDAHADINLNVTSTSGNMHGMPVSFFTEELSSFSPRLDWIRKKIPARKIAYIGLRSVDPFESSLLRNLGICAFSMDKVEKYGIRKVLEMVTRAVDPCGNSKFHVSFDIDGLDPSETPSTGTPVRGGLTLREGITIMEHFNATNRLSVVDIVEFNPELGSSADVDITLEAIHEIVKAAFGNQRMGNQRREEELQNILKNVAV